MKRRVVIMGGVLFLGVLLGGMVFCLRQKSAKAETKTSSAGETAVSTSLQPEENTDASYGLQEEEPEPVIRSTQVYRMGFPADNRHYFTADRAEKEQMEEQGWSYEGVACEEPTDSAVPVQKIVSPSGAVRFLADAAAAEELQAQGWHTEGTVWYSDETMQVPVYEVSYQDSYHYTTGFEEAQQMIAQGWTDNGVAWYARKAGGGVENTFTQGQTRTSLLGADFSDVYDYRWFSDNCPEAAQYRGDEFRMLIYYLSVELPQGRPGKKGVTQEQILEAQNRVPAEGLMRLGEPGMNEVDGIWYLFDQRGIWTNHLIGQTPDESVNEQQQALVQTCHEIPSPGPGMCAMYISQVWAALGHAYPYGDAVDMYNNWCPQSDIASLKVGMIVAVATHPHSDAGAQYGHIGFYVGGGHVMDNVGVIRTVDLSSWLEYYGPTSAPAWGWVSNEALA